MANVTTSYLVLGAELKKQGNNWVYQSPEFCPNRPFTIEFGDGSPIFKDLDLGSGYIVHMNSMKYSGTDEFGILYVLEKPGSPFSDPLLGVTRGDLEAHAPVKPTDAPFPYWFFYANVEPDLKVWIRFMEAQHGASRPSLLTRHEVEESRVSSKARK
jgi:hypothetical protein